VAAVPEPTSSMQSPGPPLPAPKVGPLQEMTCTLALLSLLPSLSLVDRELVSLLLLLWCQLMSLLTSLLTPPLLLLLLQQHQQ